jgi:hypothetical protein
MVRPSKAFQNPAEQAELREYNQTIGRGTIQPEPVGAKSCIGGMVPSSKNPAQTSFSASIVYTKISDSLKIVLHNAVVRENEIDSYKV